jgi:hypothetical protein
MPHALTHRPAATIDQSMAPSPSRARPAAAAAAAAALARTP